MALPMTSARSQAMIASSQISQSAMPTGRGKASLHACARSRSAAMPSRAARACSRMAIRLEIMMTERSV